MQLHVHVMHLRIVCIIIVKRFVFIAELRTDVEKHSKHNVQRLFHAISESFIFAQFCFG